MKGYGWLSLAIVTEIFGTSMLKLSEGFTELLPSIGVMIGFGLAFYCLSISIRTLPLSLAYAIWSGVGTALTAVIGVWIWGDAWNSYTVGGILLIIGGVVLLNGSKNAGTAGKAAEQG
ncbi:QacE family quaternary ammonium compound efflux SMR transporter [Paenibacillus sp. MY03]|uniref:DMT family transporter n=1 Tax=Paenibacillus sp. MY03 TaxID=302980 RepID=UPI000B3BF1CB|nr:multidrug efflux SMR transporter [Paenibacillus sp. MY03]OUS69625.1 QacE family quaternary ammonium compound efflux SMR transporter [Paenibacillus sp. MY03]